MGKWGRSCCFLWRMVAIWAKMNQSGAKDLFATLQEEVPQECQPALLPPQSLHAAAPCGGPAEMLWGAFGKAWWFSWASRGCCCWVTENTSLSLPGYLVQSTWLLAPDRRGWNPAVQEQMLCSARLIGQTPAASIGFTGPVAVGTAFPVWLYPACSQSVL